MELGQAYAEVLTEDQRRALMEAAEELIDTTLMDLAASDRHYWTADNWLMTWILDKRNGFSRDVMGFRALHSITIGEN
jgi:hypothetical protein